MEAGGSTNPSAMLLWMHSDLAYHLIDNLWMNWAIRNSQTHYMPFEFEKRSLSAFEILLPEGKPKFEEMSSKHKAEIESAFAQDKKSKVSSSPWLIVTDPKNLQGTYMLLNGDPKCCG